MKRQIAIKTLSISLLVAGLGWNGIASSIRAAEPTYTANQVISLQEPGKPARLCTIVSSSKQSNGKTVYTVKANDSGELLMVKFDANTTNIVTTEPKDPLLSTVNETLKTTNPTQKPSTASSGHETSGLLSRLTFSSSKSTTDTKAPASPTVNSTMTAQPVIIDNAPVETVLRQPLPLDPKMPPAAELIPSHPTSSAATQIVQVPVAPVTPVAPVVMRPIQEPISVKPIIQAPAQLPREVQLQSALRDALQPSERELAAMQLSQSTNYPPAKLALMHAAKEDPAPTVRACCLRCLVKVAPGDNKVVSLLETAKEDSDSHVRNEAADLLNQIKK